MPVKRTNLGDNTIAQGKNSPTPVPLVSDYSEVVASDTLVADVTTSDNIVPNVDTTEPSVGGSIKVVSPSNIIFSRCDTTNDGTATWSVHSGINVTISIDSASRSEGTGCIKVTIPPSTTAVIKCTINSGSWDLRACKYIRVLLRIGLYITGNQDVWFGEAAYNEQDYTINISGTTSWQAIAWDISKIASASRDAVTIFAVSMTTNASGTGYFFIDNAYADTGASTQVHAYDGHDTYTIYPPQLAWDMTTYTMIKDDFIGTDLIASATSFHSEIAWTTGGTANTVVVNQDRNGVIQVAGEGGVGPGYIFPAGSDTMLPHVRDRVPITFVCRQAQYNTTAAITRWFGMADSTLTATPTNGVYFRYSTGANIYGVVRSGGSENALDLGVTSAANAFHTLKFIWLQVTTTKWQVYYYIDSVLKGSWATLIPSANLYLSMGESAASNNGFYLDYVQATQSRI